MSNASHLQTAREWGAQKALEQAGYKSAEEVIKEATDLGLVEQPQQPAQPQLRSFGK